MNRVEETCKVFPEVILSDGTDLESLQGCRKPFLVCGLQLNGRGDIHGAHEVFLRAQKLMPQAPGTFTILKPRFGALEQFSFELGGYKFVDIATIQKEENWDISDEKTILKAIDTFKTIIIFPTYHDSLLPEEILRCKATVIKLRENSVGTPTSGTVNGPTWTLGLDKEEKGVLFPFGSSFPLLHQSETSLERLSHLEKLDPALVKAILGADFSGQAIEDFHKTSKLYFAYFAQPSSFFSYVNALLSCKEGNPVICCAKESPPGLIRNIRQTLLENGFNRIEVIEFGDPTHFETESESLGSEGKRCCTFIFRSMREVEMDCMLDAAEDESLTTGDLSPFRFLLHGKTIVYDVCDHKKGMATALINLASAL